MSTLGSILAGFDAVHRTPSKSSVSGRTPITAATQKPTQTGDHLAPGSTNRLVALGLGTTTPATDAVPTREECSFPIATTSKLTHEANNDLTTSEHASDTFSGDTTPGQHAPENGAKPVDVFFGEPSDHPASRKTKEPEVNYNHSQSRDVNQVPVGSASDIDQEFQALAKVEIITEYQKTTKEDDVLQILFGSNTPQQPPNDQPDGPYYCPDDFTIEQKKDLEIRDIFDYAESGKLPADDVKARRLVLEGALFAVTDGILYFLDPKQGN